MYVHEQLQILEKAIVNQSCEKYVEAFGGKDSVSIEDDGFENVFMYQHFIHYEGPLLARYMIITQLYSLFERHSISFSKDISRKYELLSIKDLNGNQTFKGIKTYYTKVAKINFSEWCELDKLRQVRNLIAHCDGYVTYSEQKSKIIKLAELDENMIILSDDRLAIDEEFIKRSMRAILSFFDIVESMASEPDNMLDFSWGHINQFKSFDLKVTETQQITREDK